MLAALVLVLSPWGIAAPTSEPPVAVSEADPADPASGPASEQEGLRPELPDEQRVAEAGTAFTEGVVAYKEERYEDAVRSFARARDLAPHPDTLYNLGLAQQRAGDHLGAWRSFEDLLEQTTDENEREDIEAALAVSRTRVVLLRVRADSPDVVCLDGQPMPLTRSDGVYMLRTTPGQHRLDVGRQRRMLELVGGETRMIEISSRAPVPPPQPPRRRLRVLAGFSIVGAGAAAGLGFGAGLVRAPPLRLGLGAGAAVTGTVALSSTVIALVVHRRARRFEAPPPLRNCP